MNSRPKPKATKLRMATLIQRGTLLLQCAPPPTPFPSDSRAVMAYCEIRKRAKIPLIWIRQRSDRPVGRRRASIGEGSIRPSHVHGTYHQLPQLPHMLIPPSSRHDDTLCG